MPENHVPLRRATQLSAIVILAAIVLNASAASAQPLLGSAQGFAVLGASTVTNTGASILTGNAGVSPGTELTGFLPAPANTIAGPGTVTPGLGVVTGTIYAGGMVAAQAHGDAAIAHAALGLLACDRTLAPTQILGMGALSTLPSGVYCFPSSAQLTGTLTLTGSGPWIFKIGTTLTTASNAIVLVDGSNCGSIFWRLGTSATLGTGTHFAGNVLAMASITATTGVSVSGSLMALTGAVTLDTNAVTSCQAGSGGGLPPPVDKCDDDRHHRHHHHHGDGHDNDDNDHHDDDNDKDHKDKDKDHHGKCNQGVGNGSEGCDPGNSNHRNPSNDERGGTPGNPGRKGGNR